MRMSETGKHGSSDRRPRLLVVTDRYPVDPDRSPTAWMLSHLQAISTVAEVEVVSLVRLFPRLKNLFLGGYDRGQLRRRLELPAEEHPFPRVTVRHRRCLTIPDRLGWSLTPWLFRLQQHRWLTAFIRDLRPDVVLVHFVHPSAPLALESARVNGVPVWIDENETLLSFFADGLGRLRAWILRYAAEADVVITQCSTQTDELRALLPETRLVDIPLGFEMEAPTPQALAEGSDAEGSDAAGGEVGDVLSDTNGATIRLLCVTRLDQPSKNVHLLLRGLAEARTSAGCDFRLTIAGDGYLRGKLQREAERLGLGDAVAWHGWVSPQKLRILRSEADAAVQPSEYESFGMVALEAVGSGLPLVACAHAGVVPDLVALGAAVIPFDVVSPATISSALQELAGRLPELRRQSIEARGRILEQYSWAAHAARYARVLQSEVEKTDGRHRG